MTDTIKINREMLVNAVKACIERKGISLEDMPREVELELFGSRWQTEGDDGPD